MSLSIVRLTTKSQVSVFIVIVLFVILDLLNHLSVKNAEKATLVGRYTRYLTLSYFASYFWGQVSDLLGVIIS